MEWSDVHPFQFDLPLPCRSPPEVENGAGEGRERLWTEAIGRMRVTCYGASIHQLLSLTRLSHPSFSSHCYTGLQVSVGGRRSSPLRPRPLPFR
jgi:hypothetical protein